MSSDLRKKKLGDVVALVVDNRGRNPKSYAENGIPVIDNYLITGDGTVKLSEVKRFIDDETYESFLREYIQEDDVLMTLVGNGYGKVAITPKEMCAIIQNTIGLRCNKNNDNQYLYYLLFDNREALMNLNRGAAQPSIKVGDVLDLEFQFPSLKEQRRVAGILRSIDSVIELNRQTSQTLEQMAQAIFKSWFVDFEPVKAKIAALEAGGSEDDALLAAMQAIAGSALFATDAADADAQTQLARLQAEHPEQYTTLRATAELFPSAMQESELGEIPEGWDVGTLADFSDLNKNSWTAKTIPEEIDYVDLANTKNGVIESTTKYLSGDAPSRARRKLFNGDTIIGTVRPGNRSFAFIRQPSSSLTGSTGFAVLSPKSPEFAEYIYIAATSDEAINHLAHLADGGAYPAVRSEVVVGITVVVPGSPVLMFFHEMVRSYFDISASLKVESKSLSELRDTLLPKLLSGELSVAEAE